MLPCFNCKEVGALFVRLKRVSATMAEKGIFRLTIIMGPDRFGVSCVITAIGRLVFSLTLQFY